MADNGRMTRQEAVDRAWDLATSIDICMFVTWDGARQRARPLSARPDRDAHRIYFLVDAAGAKDGQIDRFPTVTMAFADTTRHNYVTITGTAVVSNDRAKIRDLWSSTDKAWWDSADDPSIRVVAVTPEDAEVWVGPSRFTGGAKMLLAALTGAKPEFGENRKVESL